MEPQTVKTAMCALGCASAAATAATGLYAVMNGDMAWAAAHYVLSIASLAMTCLIAFRTGMTREIAVWRGDDGQV